MVQDMKGNGKMITDQVQALCTLMMAQPIKVSGKMDYAMEKE